MFFFFVSRDINFVKQIQRGQIIEDIVGEIFSLTAIVFIRHFEKEMPLTLYHGREMSTISGNEHDRHLRTRGKYRKHKPQASVFCVSRVFSNVRTVLSLCDTRLRLLHLVYDIEVMWRKTIKHTFSMLYTLIKHGFLTNQSTRSILSIL